MPLPADDGRGGCPPHGTPVVTVPCPALAVADPLLPAVDGRGGAPAHGPLLTGGDDDCPELPHGPALVGGETVPPQLTLPLHHSEDNPRIRIRRAFVTI